eukprot:CAMPEP_0197563170 /NCGR_PEP_ID=MMETSP1320-20131121/28242_1 /TAXON_ID=91990 /ORGANISM="Bolidomonas sp., Strain RCC2347" /LENGTH=493 /DNA_ID=CAMNT_0043124959 /DNA_START=92 /DNA_END=1573 /DNA_ORIENTATION=-
MSKASLLLTLFCASLGAAQKIEHVVVLMLENRAFDHMLGYLQNVNPDIKGCTPDSCSNPEDPSDPTSAKVPFTYNAVYQQADPCHSIECTTRQVFGSDDDSVPPKNQGFVSDYSTQTGNASYAPQIMDGFHPTHVPAIYNLSLEYAVFDEWYASVPGPTMVNRAYAASATSHGMGFNDPKVEARGMPQKTMFTQLLEMGLDYRVYFQQFPSVLQHQDMRRPHLLSKYRQLHKFHKDVRKGDLPQFTWLEPGYFDGHGFSATDQHPDHDVSAGDKLIKDVFESIRASPLWEKTAFVITYDEHGGFFDHVPPPQPVPSPDNIASSDPPFNFERIGVRIPTIVVSPLIPKGTVVHSTSDEGEYEHSSIVATVIHKLFKSANGTEPHYLTRRDAWASTFEHVFSLEEPRQTPKEVPGVESHRVSYPDKLPPLDGKMPVSDLQLELIQVAAELAIEGKCVSDKDVMLGVKKHENEGEAGEWIMQRVEECLGMKLERKA